MSERYVADTDARDAFHDLLIVDEGQDFEPEWIPAVSALLHSNGRFYLLADEDQQLYDRPVFDLEDAVTLTCSDNFRSPRAIVNTIMALDLSSQPLRAAGPHTGQPPDMHVYETPQQMLELTERAVQDYLKQGYGVDDIVLLSYRGRGSSLLMAQTEVAGHALRRHLGKFTAAGEPVWTDGTLLAETVFRYKGQAAPAVILTEIDFAEMNEKARRRLFVGLTRARMTATLIMSMDAERVITRLLA
jgi:superfamily I DNA and RNA helicase